MILLNKQNQWIQSVSLRLFIKVRSHRTSMSQNTEVIMCTSNVSHPPECLSVIKKQQTASSLIADTSSRTLDSNANSFDNH